MEPVKKPYKTKPEAKRSQPRLPMEGNTSHFSFLY